jgi:tetratricopeptide (TPR) repeat protein
VTTGARRIGATALTAALAASIGGCDHTQAPAGSAATSRVRASEAASPPAVALPDVSRLAPSVQAQIRERHSALMAKLADRSTPRAVLGAAYGELGLILMAAEYYEVAASCYQTAQSLVPDEARWPYYLGHLYRLQGESLKAGQFFSRALELQPSDAPTLIWLGEVLLDQDRPDEAEPLFLRALSRDPASAAALSGVGRAALAKRDFARAVEYLERALSAEPRALSLHYPLAAAYRGIGQLDSASTHLAQRGSGRPAPRDPLMDAYDAVLHTPLNYETQGLRALESRQVNEAIDLFRAGLALAPDDPKLRHRLGTALFMAGDADGSVREFQEALRLAPEFPRAHFGLGLVLNLRGRQAEAIEHFSAAVRYQPDYLEARLALADALRSAGRLKESLPQFARIVELDPSLAEAWVMYARTLAQLDRYADAKDVITRAMRIHPREPELADLLARLPAAPESSSRPALR